ncbi:MAG: cytochrome c3 family protein [bacterium]
MVNPAKKLYILFLLCFLIQGFFCLKGLQSCLAQEIPESIIIEHDIHRLDMFGPVHFGHRDHIESGIDCQKCHHEWEVNSYDMPLSCVTCHGRDRAGDAVSLRTAFMKQCLGCHIITGPDGNKTGPTICTSCHKHKR